MVWCVRIFGLDRCVSEPLKLPEEKPPISVRGHSVLGNFPSTREMAFFNPGEIPQYWGNSVFSFLILTLKMER